MKKLLALSMALLMSCSIFTACKDSEKSNSTADKTAKPVNITIWHSAEAGIIDVLQKQVDTLAPNVVVKFERKENMGDALKLVGNDTNSAPDMYFSAHDKIGVFAEMGILAPITDFISADDMKDLLPMTVDAGKYKDTQYQLPTYFETLLFMYNKDLMKNVPTTTDDLLKYMEQNTADGKYGYVEQHSTAYYVAAWMQSYGGYIIDKDAKPGLDSQGTIDALKYHQQFIKYMPADGDWNTVTTLFKEGKAHSTINGPWLIPDVKKAGINLGIAPMPTINKTGKPLSPFSGVQGVQILKSSADKKDAIAAVLKQLSSPELGTQLAKAAGCAPANKKCYDNADVTSNEIVMAEKKSAENAIPMPNVPEIDVMWTVTENALVNVNKNNADVETECANAQKEALAQIKAMQ